MLVVYKSLLRLRVWSRRFISHKKKIPRLRTRRMRMIQQYSISQQTRGVGPMLG